MVFMKNLITSRMCNCSSALILTSVLILQVERVIVLVTIALFLKNKFQNYMKGATMQLLPWKCMQV